MSLDARADDDGPGRECEHPAGTFGFGHDGAKGLLESAVHSGSGVGAYYEYDALKRVAWVGHGVNPAELFRRESYTYNAAGIRTRVDVDGDNVAHYHKLWSYDALYRLTGEHKRRSSDLLSLWGRAYGFDAGGNQTEMVHFDGSTTVTTTYDYNDGDQLVERTVGSAEDPEVYYYDDNGNLAAHRDHPDLNTAVYTHSRENRLEAFEPSEWRQMTDPSADWREMVYDDFGRRLLQREGEGQQVLRRYYYDGLNVVLAKEKSSATSNAWRTRTVATLKPGALGARLHERRIDSWTGGGAAAAWTDRWFHYDLIGNVIAETDGDGWEAALVDMEAFGNVQSGGQGKYRLTGKEYDAAVGAYYFNARWYDAVTGRFLQVDPYFARMLKSYAYCRNNPVNRVDLDGRKDRPWPFNGVVCNNSNEPILAWDVDRHEIVELLPGECTPCDRDFDFFLCNGQWQKVGPAKKCCPQDSGAPASPPHEGDCRQFCGQSCDGSLDPGDCFYSCMRWCGH